MKNKNKGYENHPQVDLIKRQMCGYSTVMSFILEGTPEDADTFVHSLKVIILIIYSNN